jgi:hypothetical protein
MRLAEALILRAAHQKKMATLKQRLIDNALVQEGVTPAENPEDLLKQLRGTCEEFESLVAKINATNSSTRLASGATITDGLARRDALRVLFAVYRDLAAAATPKQSTYTRSEIRFKSTVDVKSIQKHVDDYAKEQRELDTRIQEANWSTDLVE